MNILELRRMMLALETAIERVETESSQHDGVPLLSPAAPVGISDASSDRAIVTRDPIVLIDAPVVRMGGSAADAFTRGPTTARIPAQLKAILRFGALAVLAAAIVVIADRQFHLLGARPSIPAQTAVAEAAPPTPAVAEINPAPQPELPAAVPPPPPVGPLPSVYGVYAVSGGNLYELEALVGRVPDQRVFMSTMIATPSRTILPDGQVTFIVYRRDLVSSAPDRAAVRVIAKIARAMTFNKDGRPSTVKVDDSWTMRSMSFGFRVAPVSGNSEMIALKPENEDFALSPGRYGLVIKGQAYDFTVAGPITDTAQCLERVEAANGSFYSECRKL
jgi:hypothetical protein